MAQTLSVGLPRSHVHDNYVVKLSSVRKVPTRRCRGPLTDSLLVGSL